MLLYKASDGFIYRKIVNEDFLIPTGQQLLKNNGIVVLNETAALLWNEIKTEKTAQQLCSTLEECYDADGADLSADVAAFIESMKKLDAIEVIEK